MNNDNRVLFMRGIVLFGMLGTLIVPIFLILLVLGASLGNAALWGVCAGFTLFCYMDREGEMGIEVDKLVEKHKDLFEFEIKIRDAHKARKAILSEAKRDIRQLKWANLMYSLWLSSEGSYQAKCSELEERYQARALKQQALDQQWAELKGDPRWEEYKSQS